MNRSSGPSQQLVYYINLAAPPSRRPATGDEPYLRPEVGFSPSWYDARCNINFGEVWHVKPEYRLEAWERMASHLRSEFPGRQIGGVLSGDPPDLVTGLLGSIAVPLLFGFTPVYYPNKWPAAEGSYLSEAEILALEPPNLAANRWFDLILTQVHDAYRLTGSARGFINWQGVLNTAFRLRGQEVFVDLLQRPDVARRLFHVVATTMIDGMARLYGAQAELGTVYDFANIGNCVVNMISGDQYRTHLLPFDREIALRFPSVAIHNCAWDVTPYAPSYATIENLGYIDMGIRSDLVRVRELCPRARRNVLYTSMDLMRNDTDQIRADLERIARDLGPCDVGFPNIEADVPNKRVELVFSICEELSDVYGSESVHGVS